MVVNWAKGVRCIWLPEDAVSTVEYPIDHSRLMNVIGVQVKETGSGNTADGYCGRTIPEMKEAFKSLRLSLGAKVFSSSEAVLARSLLTRLYKFL